MSAQPSYNNLTEAVIDALIAHYTQWGTEHSTDDIYAYVIYATALVSDIVISALAEQGLKQIAADYKNRCGYRETLDQLEHELRWSVADTPYCGDHQEVFESVNERLQSMMPYVNSLEIDDPAFSTHTDRYALCHPCCCTETLLAHAMARQITPCALR